MIDAADEFVQILMLFETAIWRCVMLIAHSLSWARGSLAEAGRCVSTRYIIVDFTSRDCSVFYCCVSCLSLHGLVLAPILTLGLTNKLWTWTNTCVAYMLYLLATDDCWNMVLFMKYIVFLKYDYLWPQFTYYGLCLCRLVSELIFCSCKGY